MGIVSTFMLALALSMDAFAVSVSSAVSLKKIDFNTALRFGLYFGVFQAVMPIIGWTIAMRITHIDLIKELDHWIAFALLALIGGKMLVGAWKNEEHDENTQQLKDVLCAKNMLVLAIATSIDALAVGVSLAALDISIWYVAIVIGLVTCALSIVGAYLGHKIGVVFKKGSEIFGGSLLVLIGTKILIEHLFT